MVENGKMEFMLLLIYIFKGWGLCWCFMKEILLRLPLSVSVKRDGGDPLNPPVKRNYIIQSQIDIATLELQ